MTSDNTSPIGRMFELQRETMKQSQRMIEESAQVPAEMADSMREAAESHTDTHGEAIEFGQRAINDVLDTVEATSPAGEETIADIRSAVDEGFDDLADQHDELVESMDEAAAEGIEEYSEVVEQTLDYLDTQLDLVLEASEEMESQTVEGFEEVIDQYEQLQADIAEQAEELPGSTQEQLTTFEEQLESQIDRYQEQIDQVQSRFEDLQSDMQDAVEGNE